MSYRILHVFKYQAKKLDFYVYFFCVFWQEMQCAHLNVPQICAGMRDACMKPDVVFTVFIIVYM